MKINQQTELEIVSILVHDKIHTVAEKHLEDFKSLKGRESQPVIYNIDV